MVLSIGIVQWNCLRLYMLSNHLKQDWKTWLLKPFNCWKSFDLRTAAVWGCVLSLNSQMCGPNFVWWVCVNGLQRTQKKTCSTSGKHQHVLIQTMVLVLICVVAAVACFASTLSDTILPEKKTCSFRLHVCSSVPEILFLQKHEQTSGQVKQYCMWLSFYIILILNIDKKQQRCCPNRRHTSDKNLICWYVFEDVIVCLHMPCLCLCRALSVHKITDVSSILKLGRVVKTSKRTQWSNAIPLGLFQDLGFQNKIPTLIVFLHKLTIFNTWNDWSAERLHFWHTFTRLRIIFQRECRT